MGVHREADGEKEAERKRLRRKHRREKEGDRGRENRNATVADNPPDSPEDSIAGGDGIRDSRTSRHG